MKAEEKANEREPSGGCPEWRTAAAEQGGSPWPVQPPPGGGVTASPCSSRSPVEEWSFEGVFLVAPVSAV